MFGVRRSILEFLDFGRVGSVPVVQLKDSSVLGFLHNLAKIKGLAWGAAVCRLRQASPLDF